MTDLDLPEPPTSPLPARLDSEDVDTPNIDNGALQCEAPVLDLDFKNDLQNDQIHEIEKKVFENEMKSYSVSLHNLHSSFKYVTSIRGVISIVDATLRLHKQRREAVKDTLRELKPRASFELDNMGNIIIPSPKKGV